MANDKLQQLTDRLYSEGLAKGREEGEKILESSRKQAQQILDEAKKEALKIVSEANEQAQKTAVKSVSDIKMASAQALDQTKAGIENVIQAKAVDEKVASALGETAFIKEIISQVAQRFSTETSDDLALILPESTKAQVEDYIKVELTKAIGRGIEVSADKKLKAGFCIGPRDGGYYVSFSDETFAQLIREYLRPATRKILFGE